MGKPKVLIVEPQISSRSILDEFLSEHYETLTAHDADSAIGLAAENDLDLVVLELSLGGHSGMEFLYEFRTYTDWIQIPVIVFSTVKLPKEVLESRAWESLNLYKYLYKSDTSLAELKSTIEKSLSVSA